MDIKTRVLAITGMAFWWPLLRNSVTGFVFGAQSPGIFGQQAIFCLFAASAVLLCVLLAVLDGLRGSRCVAGHGGQGVPDAPPSGVARAVVMAVCVLASLTNCGAVFASGVLHDGFLVASAVALASCYVALSLAWARWLAVMSAGYRDLLLLSLGSYAASFAVGYLSYLPEPFVYIRPLGGPVISGLLWYACARLHVVAVGTRGMVPADRSGVAGSGEPPVHPASPALAHARFAVPASQPVVQPRGLYVLTLTFFLVASVATGFINAGSVAYAPTGSTLVRDTLSLVLTLLVMVVAGAVRQSERVGFMLTAIVGFALFVGIFIATFLRDASLAWGTGLMQAGKSLFSLLLLVLVLARPSAPSVRGVALLFVIPTIASSFISYVVVPAVVRAFAIDYAGFWGTLSLTMGFVLGVFVFVFLSSFAIRSLPVADNAHLGGPVSPEGDAVQVAGERRGLTEREQDVFALLVRGNTYKKTAELLGVSENTVQFHSKNIYRKFGVHTKQELIDQVGANL